MKSNCNNPEKVDKPEWCENRECRWWWPWSLGDVCPGCGVAPRCEDAVPDAADDGRQMRIDFGEEDDQSEDGR